MAHLLWNPSRDEKDLIKEFLEGYYGPAAPYLSKYLDIINTPSNTQIHMPMSHKNWGYLTIDEMNKATRLFDSAEKAVAKDPTYLARVRRERLSLDHIWLLNYKRYQHDAQVGHTEFLAPDPIVSCRQQLELLHQYPGQYLKMRGIMAMKPGWGTWRTRPCVPNGRQQKFLQNVRICLIRIGWIFRRIPSGCIILGAM